MELPRERFLKAGEGALSDYELLAIILRTGARGEDVVTTSRKLLQKYEGWTGLKKAGIGELSSERGVGRVKAITIKALFEICRRINSEGSGRERIMSPEDAYEFVNPYFWKEEKEKLLLLILDVKNKLLKLETLGLGGGNGVVITPKEIFTPAIREGGSGIILAHNHPSGDPSPSKADVTFTKRVKDAGEIIGIQLVDHIIVGDRKFISLKRNGNI